MTKEFPDYGPDIVVRRSKRRTRTVTARYEGNHILVMAPAGLDPKTEKDMVLELVKKVKAKNASSLLDNKALHKRAQQLNTQVLGGRAKFNQIKWVRNMTRRWGSCSTDKGVIRISHRLAQVPTYVLDDVIVHELVHTFIPHHGPEFWEWARLAPRHESARGYLEAFARWGPFGSDKPSAEVD